MRALFSLAVLLFAFGSADALACSCAKRTQAEEFKSSSAVFVGRVKSVKQSPAAGADSRVTHEVVEIEVLESWKGSWLPNDIVRFEADVSEPTGMCEVSVVNSPAWVTDAESKGPAHFSGLWLMYVEGEAPFALSLCSRSRPLELGGFGDLEALFKWAKPLKPRSESAGSNKSLERTRER